MSAELLHPVPASEIPGYMRTMVTTFMDAGESDHADEWLERVRVTWDPERTWAVRDRGRCVATLRTFDRTITVPGVDGTTEVLRADALTSVTVAATHRRQGWLSRMLDGSLRAARDRGDALSILIAAEWPIYGRFGYGPAASAAEYVLLPRRLGGPLAPASPGRVRQVEIDELGEVGPALFEAARRRRAGQVDRPADWWTRVLGLDGLARHPSTVWNIFVHEGDDGPDGLLTWRPTRDFGFTTPLAAITVGGLFAAGDAAERDLWAYLVGIDAVDEIALPDRPVDEPLRWILRDGRALELRRQHDFLWSKLLDVPAALSARGYAVAGDLVLEVTDDSAVSVAGRYRLAADPSHGGAEVAPTTAAPDLTVAAPALAGAFFGGMPLRARRADGAVTEHTPGALARADAMFLTALAPWNATGF